MGIKITFSVDEKTEKNVEIIVSGVDKAVKLLLGLTDNLHFLTKKIENFMADQNAQLDAISGQLDAANGKLDAQASVITGVKTNLDGIQGDVADLKAQIAALPVGGVDQTKLDALAAKAQSLSDKVDAATSSIQGIADEAKSIDDSTTQTTTGGDGGTGDGGTGTGDGGTGTGGTDTGSGDAALSGGAVVGDSIHGAGTPATGL